MMSAKHPAKSLALDLPAAVRVPLRAHVGRNGSLADAARRVLARVLAGPVPPRLADYPGGQGRPVRLQLPRALRATLTAEARARRLDEAGLARALLVHALVGPAVDR